MFGTNSHKWSIVVSATAVLNRGPSSVDESLLLGDTHPLGTFWSFLLARPFDSRAAWIKTLQHRLPVFISALATVASQNFSTSSSL